MKQFYLSIVLLIFISSQSIGQFNPIKGFDYSLLENKTLWVPKYKIGDKQFRKLIRKDKMKEFESLSRSVTELNNLWDKVMSGSSYDATDYIIKDYDYRKFFKDRPEDGIALVFVARESNGVRNIFAEMYVAQPKKRMIAQSPINNLDITDEYDLRLIINMLNQSLNSAMELEEEGDKSFRSMRNKYKQNFVEFFNEIDNKTFLAPKYNDVKKNKELKEALSAWSISPYNIVHENEINKKRKESAECCYYWKNIPYYAGLITYNMNMIVSTESDEVLFVFVGKKRLKSSNIEEAQKKMIKRAEKYRRQLEM
ncbi:hypothetical protein E1176_13360 [Fulvivirga sp. RKSG066]|uniref:hypothetical protein n=1 Tax=Fulvivirga aurantia TaxID=2529383 RepID=UPI0012BD366F|nr:hypothetical protein [Fulvivirga aurantia]MTI22013.1 hypothetical protein [Fulvivirga aurantia]